MRTRRRRLMQCALTVLIGSLGVAVEVSTQAHPAAAQADPTITIPGRGFGHGVGMSQYGAYGMAQRGVGASEITAHYYQGTTVGTATQPTNVRVLIATPGSTTVTGTAAVGYYVNGVQHGQSGPGQSVTIAAVGSSIALNGTVLPAGILVVGYNGSPMAVSAASQSYRWGNLAVHMTAPGQLKLIVENMTMDQYLYGLGEMPSSWPQAALEAQALAGRSYAKWSIDDRRRKDPARIYDLEASTADQVYVGYSKESDPLGDRWVGAVNATSSRTILYGGATIQAFYSSSSGGHTDNSGYIFVTQLPYLTGVPDPDDLNTANPYRQWSRSYSGGQMGAWVRGVPSDQKGYDGEIGTVTSIAVSGDVGVSGRTDRATIRLNGTTASTTMTGSRFYSMVNANAPSNRLPSTLIAVPQEPTGNVDRLTPSFGGARVIGWALDPNTTGPIDVHVYVDGQWAGAYSANQDRPDLALAYPDLGTNHGFDIPLALSSGAHSVCVYAINVGAGSSNPAVGCPTITIGGNPFGNLEGPTRIAGGLRVAGWAIDPDTTDAVQVHVYVDGVYITATTASGYRPDVGVFYSGYGDAHGFSTDVAVGAGSHQVCAYAINVGPGSTNPAIGCRTVLVSGMPFGSVDGLRNPSGTTVVAGWAIDPDTAGPVTLHLYRDGAWAGEWLAQASRLDVWAAYPTYGDQHGFEVPVVAGQTCVYAIDTTSQTANPLLGCVSL